MRLATNAKLDRTDHGGGHLGEQISRQGTQILRELTGKPVAGGEIDGRPSEIRRRV